MSKLLINPTNGYTKPKDEKNVGNYPNTLVEAVYYDEERMSLDAFLDELESAIDDSEKVSNKVTAISSSSTDEQYPSAKAVYDAVQAGAGGDSTVIIDAYFWEEQRGDGNFSRGLTKEEALQVLRISEEELDRLVPTSAPNKDDNYCVIFNGNGYYFPNYRHYDAGAYSWYDDGTTVYYEGEASEVNFMIIVYDHEYSRFVLNGKPTIVARLPVSEGDPVLYDIYGNMEAPK